MANTQKINDQLTVCILAQENTAILAKVVESVKEIANVVLFDTSGNGLLKNIYKEVTVIAFPPITDFAKTRNKALNTITTDWVLFLDSDEILEKDAVKKFEKIFTSKNCGYYLNRKDVFLGKSLNFGEAGNQPQLRLFKTKNAKFTGAVHETVQLNGSIGKLDVIIYHHAHQSISSFFNKVSWYAQLVAQERAKQYNFLNTLFQLLMYPKLKFLYTVLIKQSWRDGWRGITYSLLMSLHSLFVRIYSYELAQKK